MLVKGLAYEKDEGQGVRVRAEGGVRGAGTEADAGTGTGAEASAGGAGGEASENAGAGVLQFGADCPTVEEAKDRWSVLPAKIFGFSTAIL